MVERRRLWLVMVPLDTLSWWQYYSGKTSQVLEYTSVELLYLQGLLSGVNLVLSSGFVWLVLAWPSLII